MLKPGQIFASTVLNANDPNTLATFLERFLDSLPQQNVKHIEVSHSSAVLSREENVILFTVVVIVAYTNEVHVW